MNLPPAAEYFLADARLARRAAEMLGTRLDAEYDGRLDHDEVLFGMWAKARYEQEQLTTLLGFSILSANLESGA